MLALVEPCIMDGILDRPHLGCAMLIAACQEKGIKTTLIKGQTRYLKDMFVNDSEELWSLMQDLKESDLEKTGIIKYRKSIQEKGLRHFQDELKSLYQYVIVDKNPRSYFNALLAEKLNNLHRIFVAVYFYYLKELNHHKLKIIERYVSEIIKSNPRYIGFSLEGGFGPLSRTIRKQIKRLTEIPVIVGGALTPFIDLKKLAKIFEEEHFDYLVMGAGERALPSLIEAIENKEEPKGIANVFYKQDGQIKGNNLEVINDLDNLPYPDYSQFDLDLYLTPKRILPLQTARGCSWRKCTFCSHHNIDFGNYRTFSIKKVIETIKHLQDTYNCSHFVFHDEELPPGRAKQISEAILHNNVKNIYITTYARPVDGYNNNLLRLMRKAGFTLIHWGIESASQRVLNLMNKGIRVSTVSRILRESSKNKIANICFIMFAFPAETGKEAQQTIDFLGKHANYIEGVIISYFILEPHSPIAKDLTKNNIKVKKNRDFLNRNVAHHKENSQFLNRLSTRVAINDLEITSDKLKYLFYGHSQRMLQFLTSSYEFLPSEIILKYLKDGKINKIYPVTLGEIKKGKSKIILFPVNIKESLYINQHFPEKEKVLDSLQEKAFILSNGTLSIEDIIAALNKDFKNKYGSKYIRKKCTDFFQDMFTYNLALGFAKSWQS